MNWKLARPLAAALTGLTLSFGQAAGQSPAQAQLTLTSDEYRTPVVELYTSEGCSSCPPADNWLRKLGQSLDADFRAVPLAFHVDYWNYLGWTDPFSQPAFTKRQRQAAANIRRGNIYTPEFLVDGREARGGARIVRAIQTANAQKARATIAVQVDRPEADNIRAQIHIENRSQSGYAEAYLAVYESGITRKIGAGENRGRTLKHDFVVRHWSKPIAIRSGANTAGAAVEIPADWRRPNLGLAVVVFDRNSGETIQAVHGSLASLFSG